MYALVQVKGRAYFPSISLAKKGYEHVSRMPFHHQFDDNLYLDQY